MAQFPSWLPKPVAVHAANLLTGGSLDRDSKQRLARLCTDPDMQSAWKVLNRAAPDQATLIEFLNVVLNEPLFLPKSPNPLPLPNKVRKSFAKIARLAASLIDELQRVGSEGNVPESGIEELRYALLRIARSPHGQVATTEKSTGLDITAKALTLYESLGGDLDPLGLIDYLNCITSAALLAANAPSAPGPRKFAAATAARTQYIREIDNFILARFGKSMPSAVAKTTNISLDLHDNLATEDLVRKLRLSSNSPKPISRKIPAKSRS